MISEDRQGVWTVRRCDVIAALAWLAFLTLTFGFDAMHADRAMLPWCFAAMGLACVLTLTAYLGRRFRHLEDEAFERGLRAGLQRGGDGVAEMTPRPRDHDRIH